MAGFPALRSSAREAAESYVGLGVGWSAFALALIGVMLITPGRSGKPRLVSTG